jgi:sugar phosphate isomerase/epimerase
MRFSLAYLTLPDCAPPEMIRIAARTGYDLVSLRTMRMGLANEPNYDLSSDRELFRETRRALSETGLGFHDIELARIAEGTVPAAYLPAFEAAAELGCEAIISSVWTSERDFALEAFREICALARPLGLRVVLEFVPFAEIRTLAEALGFLDEAGVDDARLLVDTLHFHYSRSDLAVLEGPARDRVGFVHLCDGPAAIPPTREGLIQVARGARLYPGEGGIDLAAIVNRLPELCYSIELPNLGRISELGLEGHARRCLETAKAYLAAHPRCD